MEKTLWNSMEEKENLLGFPWNSMSQTQTEFHGVPWNSMGLFYTGLHTDLFSELEEYLSRLNNN